MQTREEMCLRGDVNDNMADASGHVKYDDCTPTRNGDEASEVTPESLAVANDYRQKLGNPGALGLLAFGATTLLVNASTAKLFAMNTTTAGVVIMYGGLTQLIAGVMEFVRGNTFGCTISTSFGAFWLATAMVWILPQKNPGTPYASLQGAEDGLVGINAFLWALILFIGFLSSLCEPLAVTMVFFTGFLFILTQSIALWANSSVMLQVAGYEGMICGVIAFYCGIAMTLNDAHKRTLLPLFPPCIRRVKS
ncbi:putative GPR1/FUN34/yaaH family [Trypanosoma cruzi]|nr:putative GPR1/FUN34/yaaH family [Trypanosoma cruzi]KAF8276440.1 putative GPR1/FUN34/yaaH family [Trypanosoma cruzi]